ncbi:glycosyltransferase [Chitinilyticum litopenaei]|uniref:glycosyltransferase n=1 Tax=Chitinilyticum litopenaei TaxID=1121276 RepID=UPI0004049A54|nr:glycosyltransferase [Chitinilyticum litopenaei]
MKVAIFLRDLGLGGVERCAVLVGEGLAARGFEVTLVLLGGSHNLWQSRIDRVKVVDLSTGWHPKQPWTWLKGWRAARRIAREHDVVIAGTFLLPLYMTYAATLGIRAKGRPAQPAVAGADGKGSRQRSHRNGQVVHEDGEQRTTTHRQAQQAGCRVMGWVHGPMHELDAFARMNPVHRFACRFVYRLLDELVFVSQHARDSLARWLGAAPKPGWRVLPNFIDDDGVGQGQMPSALHASHLSPHSPLKMLFVGRIAEEKQPGLWLDTLAALNARGLSAQLTVVGDGPLEGWLHDEADRRGLGGQLVFAGRQDIVTPWLQAADVLLLTSSFEGCPLVVLEAMALGLPVASTNAGGVYELFGERRDDFVVAEASGAALAVLIGSQDRAALSAWLLERAAQYSASATLARWCVMLREG